LLFGEKLNAMANRIFKGITLTWVVLALTYTLKAQEKWNITAGAGFPEFLNIGAGYQFNQSQAALSGILIPFAEGLIFSVSTDYYRHFGGSSKFSERKPWYLRSNLNFTSSGDKQDYQRLLYLNFRVGRDINFSPKLGLAIDIGPGFRLLKQPKTNDDFFDLAEPVIPAFGAHFFYRL
jgi:hypothetical protein